MPYRTVFIGKTIIFIVRKIDIESPRICYMYIEEQKSRMMRHTMMILFSPKEF